MNPKNNSEIINSSQITINDATKKNNNELTILKQNISNTEDENNNEIISQNEEMIKKQRQITNFDSNTIEVTKTNNVINNSYFYHKLGNCHAFFGNKNGDPFFIIGPQWPMFIALTVILNAILYFLLIKFWRYYSNLFKGLGIFFATFFQLTFTHCFVINPGFPKNDIGRQTGIPKENYKFCLLSTAKMDLNEMTNNPKQFTEELDKLIESCPKEETS